MSSSDHSGQHGLTALLMSSVCSYSSLGMPCQQRRLPSPCLEPPSPVFCPCSLSERSALALTTLCSSVAVGLCMEHVPLCPLPCLTQSTQENPWHAQAVQVYTFWGIAGGHAFTVLLISSIVTALYTHVTCHTMTRPEDYLIRAEAKYISVLLMAFFFLGRPSCLCPWQHCVCGQCAPPSIFTLAAIKALRLSWCCSGCRRKVGVHSSPDPGVRVGTWRHICIQARLPAQPGATHSTWNRQTAHAVTASLHAPACEVGCCRPTWSHTGSCTVLGSGSVANKCAPVQ